MDYDDSTHGRSPQPFGSVSVHSRAPLKWWQGWSQLFLMPAGVLLFAPAQWPRWVVMWQLAVAIYSGCKWLTWRRTPVDRVAAWRHAAYLLAWPGLDPAAFLCGQPEQPPRRDEWVRGWRNLFVGIALFFGVARLVAPRSLDLAGWIGMAAVALSLHFGLFQLLSCGWRRAGILARPLMNTPVASVSLGEFWGRRWNTAFRDLTHRFLFRPMTRRFGTRAGLAGGFVFSGLVHELVISWPAAGGYGGPTLFFAMQGAGILAERSRFGRRIGLGRGARGWLFAMLVLIAPAPCLFHPPFVERVVVPMMHAMGAL
jgi:alginate O-acetyltransferase complex protein AlgI